ncbi:MAG TPA: amidohydrolase family protein [Gemmatimonas sp.]|nr:amidohydrolase family protein [Gemmatimonas sp.]
MHRPTSALSRLVRHSAGNPLLAGALLLSGCGNGRSRGDSPEGSTPTAIAFTHVEVVDVEGGRLLANQTVVVQAGRIVAVGPEADVPVPTGTDVVDGTDRFLVPGFADMHVHLYTVGDLFTYAANGVTTVRNMAGDTSHLAMRAAVAAGRVIGPRIVTAGPVVEAAPLSHPDNVLLDSPAGVRHELLRQQAAGYDFVKVYNALSRPVYDSVVSVAREIGMPVAGHVPTSVGIDGALAARQASIEHFRGYIQALLPRSAPAMGASFRERSVAWNRIDDTQIAALVARTVAAGVWNVPTFAFTVHELSPDLAHKTLLGRPEVQFLSLQGLPKDRATTGYLKDFTDADYAETQRGLMAQFRLVRALESAGAGLLVGTDSWLSGYAFADELELLVRAGLSPARVLRMATLDAARYLGQERVSGTVATGRRADLVLLDANPLAEIGNVRRVRAVMLQGRLLRREQIDSGLAALPRNRQ